jgi:Rod binding domain-containing protein
MLTGVQGGIGAAGAAQGANADPRLGKAAHQFEALMMKELMAPLNHPSALFADESEEQAGALGEFASEALAGALSAQGGLGIAKQIVHSFSRPGASVPDRTESASGAKNIGISGRK